MEDKVGQMLLAGKAAVGKSRKIMRRSIFHAHPKLLFSERRLKRKREESSSASSTSKEKKRKRAEEENIEMCKLWNVPRVACMIRGLHRVLKQIMVDGSIQIQFQACVWPPILDQINKFPCTTCVDNQHRGIPPLKKHKCEKVSEKQVTKKYYNMRIGKNIEELNSIEANRKNVYALWSFILQNTKSKSGKTSTSILTPESSCQAVSERTRFNQARTLEAPTPTLEAPALHPSLYPPDFSILQKFWTELEELGVDNNIQEKAREMVTSLWDYRFILVFLSQSGATKKLRTLGKALSDFYNQKICLVKQGEEEEEEDDDDDDDDDEEAVEDEEDEDEEEKNERNE